MLCVPLQHEKQHRIYFIRVVEHLVSRVWKSIFENALQLLLTLIQYTPDPHCYISNSRMCFQFRPLKERNVFFFFVFLFLLYWWLTDGVPFTKRVCYTNTHTFTCTIFKGHRMKIAFLFVNNTVQWIIYRRVLGIVEWSARGAYHWSKVETFQSEFRFVFMWIERNVARLRTPNEKSKKSQWNVSQDSMRSVKRVNETS